MGSCCVENACRWQSIWNKQETVGETTTGLGWRGQSIRDLFAFHCYLSFPNTSTLSSASQSVCHTLKNLLPTSSLLLFCLRSHMNYSTNDLSCLLNRIKPTVLHGFKSASIAQLVWGYTGARYLKERRRKIGRQTKKSWGGVYQIPHCLMAFEPTICTQA